jgi:hypothetical protein
MSLEAIPAESRAMIGSRQHIVLPWNTKMSHWLRATLPILLMMATPAWAGKADPDLPKPDTEGYWRIMMQDDVATTSKCIGKVLKPECAVETYVAAFFRADDKLLSIATGVPWKAGAHTLFKDRSDKIKYRIVSSGRVGKNPPEYGNPPGK